MNYVTYHLHSELSLLDGCTNFKLYVDRAVELCQSAICFSEHGYALNWIDKKLYCKEKGIKYLHGVEIYLTESFDDKVRDNFHTVLISKNFEGVKELNTLIDRSTQEDHIYYKNRISFDEFLSISDNIIKISACMASPLHRLSEENPYYDLLLKKYDYYEIQAHDVIDQVNYNKKLYELSKTYNKPLILGTDTHSLNKYKAECRSILQKAKKIQYADEDKFDLTYKSYDEIVEMCMRQGCLPKQVYLEAINNTNIMADSVEEFELDTSFKYPKLYDNDEEVFKKRINEMYKHKLQNGIVKKNPKYIQNITEEFKVFKKLNMISFMLFMSELIVWCKENGIPVGNCRGSVGGSTIAYITDIIDVDPIVWNTVFSRFCNEDRLEIGDIDIDVSPTQRELVYNYIIERFGAEYTAYILAIGTISDKGTIDEIGRALDFITDGKIGELKETLKLEVDEDNKEKLETEIEELEASKYGLSLLSQIKKEYEVNPEKTKGKYPELFYYFDGLINTTISQSIHPAGMIASPVTLTDNYGTIWKEGKRILTINMEEVHEVSLVKYDILGLKNIEIIKDTCKLLGEPYPLSYAVNWEDKDVWNDITTSPIGVFQFESPFAFQLLKKYAPQRLNDLSLINACLRPSGASYRDRLINREFNHNPSEQIDELLKGNNGFLVFQEDCLKFLQDICGLSGSEADNVRRAIGRKQVDRLNAALPSILEGYCSKSNKPREVAEEEVKQFLEIISNSSSYMFGYNHSTGYSMIGYECGYYRYYHPLEFITSYLNNANSEEDINAGTELAKLKKISIEPIKFRHSIARYSCNPETNTIYKGMESIKFLNDKVSDELYELRDNQYKDFIEVLKDVNEKTSCNSRQLDILIKLDFFQEFGKNEKLLRINEYFVALYNKKQIKKDSLVKLGLDVAMMEKYSGKITEKIYKDIDMDTVLHEVCEVIPNKSISLSQTILNQKEILGYIDYRNDNLDKRYVLVSNIDTKYTPTMDTYCLNNGVTCRCKISKKLWNNEPLKENNIVYIHAMERKFGYKKVGEKFDKKGNIKPIFEADESKLEWWITEYSEIDDFEGVLTNPI